MAKRLEDVRTNVARIPSLRGFWQRVVEDWPEDLLGPPVSYEAVRNYHFDRDAPVSYLAQVARVFGVRLEWLAYGAGAMTEEDERLRAAEERAIQEAGNLVADAHAEIVEAFGPGGERLERGFLASLVVRTWRRVMFTPAGERLFLSGQLPGAIGRGLRAPFDALGVDPAAMPQAAFEDAIVAACAALVQVAQGTPDEKGGKRRAEA